MKVIHIARSPVPYSTPILNALARHVDLHAIYLSRDDRVNRFVDVWGTEPAFEYSFFWSRRLNLASVDLQAEFSLGISRRLTALRPDAILVSGWKLTAVEPILWARLNGRGVTMWAESTRFSGLMRGASSNRFRRQVVRGADSFISNGSQATIFLRELGVPGARIVTSRLPSGVASDGARTRARRSDGDGVRFLFVGRLVPRKRPLELIRAFDIVRGAVSDASLTMVGGGDLEREVREAAAAVPGASYVGQCEGAHLAALYAASDVLVLPALREVWGLVVNEALAHGLFVVTTDEVGSAHDLLDERSGIMLPASNLEGLAPAMIRTARTLETGDAARQRRAAAVEGCTPDRFASDTLRALELALDRSKRGRRERSST